MVEKLTPMMQQYVELKEQYKDCIIFYRLGDFYEMFFEDAIEASKILGLTLTGKDCGLEKRAPMCGIPFHAVTNYLNKLVSAGKKVAICEQLTEASKGKELVKRGIIKIVTAGTLESDAIEENQNNFVASVYLDNNSLSVCWVDITTGEMFVNSSETLNDEKIDFLKLLNDILIRIKPSEIISNSESFKVYKQLSAIELSLIPEFSLYYDWAFEKNKAEKIILQQFKLATINGLDLGEYDSAIKSSGALLTYINETQKTIMTNIINIKLERQQDSMYLDINTRRNLELVENMREKKGKGTLLWVLDKTKTPMGARKLKNWIEQPLLNDFDINLRLDGVEELFNNSMIKEKLIFALSNIRDIERICSKVSYGSITPRGMLDLSNSLKALPVFKDILNNLNSEIFKNANNLIADFFDLTDLLDRAIVEVDTPTHTREGGFIKKGFNADLDNLINAKKNAQEWINKIVVKEKELTNIKNLKISFNNVFGYFIEIPKRESDNVPLNRYTRKQTLANCERYTTDELKEVENIVLNAVDNSIKLEQQIFDEIKEVITKNLRTILLSAQNIAIVDCLLSLSIVAYKNNYVRPIINSKIKHIEISNGRHCVVEEMLKSQGFIANDTILDNDENRIMIITGPNMAGKSTYMRQVALITLMAHIGSFVPATKASICLTDRIFTRIGASDDLSLGQSTFMVEMLEVANILLNITPNSLVILDEVGRGTSTYDGLSIAWSVIEYLSNIKKGKILFATHYHELTELEGKVDGVKNYQISIKEINKTLIFLRKIIRGGADKSFGIEVAEMAGLPNSVINNAKKLLLDLQNTDLNSRPITINNLKADGKCGLDKPFDNNLQANDKNNRIVQKINELDINSLSPLEALTILYELKNLVNKGETDGKN